MKEREASLERGATAGAGTNPDRLGLLLRSPFDEDLVETIKSLPRGDRWWDEEREAWWIAAEHEEFATSAAVASFGSVKIIGLEGESDYYVDREGRTVQERLL
jgi:hypothetical protein